MHASIELFWIPDHGILTKMLWNAGRSWRGMNISRWLKSTTSRRLLLRLHSKHDLPGHKLNRENKSLPLCFVRMGIQFHIQVLKSIFWDFVQSFQESNRLICIQCLGLLKCAREICKFVESRGVLRRIVTSCLRQSWFHRHPDAMSADLFSSS